MVEREEQETLGKQELVNALAISRSKLSSDLQGLAYELDYKGKLKRSIRRNTKSWVTGAAAAGMAFSLFPRKKKKVFITQGEGQKPKKVKRSNLAFSSLKLALPFAKPLMLALATKKMNHLASRIQND